MLKQNFKNTSKRYQGHGFQVDSLHFIKLHKQKLKKNKTKSQVIKKKVYNGFYNQSIRKSIQPEKPKPNLLNIQRI